MHIMNAFVYFMIGSCILFCRNLIKCLDVSGTNVCPRLITRENSIPKRQAILACCPDYYEYEDTCIECQPGRYGYNCSHTCLPNHYGVACKNMCNCSNNFRCDPVEGCVCNEGFTGTDCKESCICYNGSCDRVTGECICSSGWHAPNCSQICAYGWYGQNCSRKCACNNNSCDHINGDCMCSPGTHGPNCSTECSEERCKNMCKCPDNAYCDRATGKCKCLTGSQSLCNADGETKTSPDQTTNYVVMYILVAAILLIIILIALVFLKVKEFIRNFFTCTSYQGEHKTKSRKTQNCKGMAPCTSVTEDSPAQISSDTGHEVRYAVNSLDSEENDYCEISDVYI